MRPVLSAQFRNKVCNILKVYREVERNAKIFRDASNLRCPDGCKLCCYSHSIEATPLELLPAALCLFEVNLADSFLESLTRSENTLTCIFLRDNDNDNSWGCTMYKFRPLICRLFGFYGRRDKNNLFQFSSCRIIKAHYPDEYNLYLTQVLNSNINMSMQSYYFKVAEYGSDFENKLMSFNLALESAIEIIQFETSKNLLFTNYPTRQ